MLKEGFLESRHRWIMVIHSFLLGVKFGFGGVKCTVLCLFQRGAAAPGVLGMRSHYVLKCAFCSRLLLGATWRWNSVRNLYSMRSSPPSGEIQGVLWSLHPRESFEGWT